MLQECRQCPENAISTTTRPTFCLLSRVCSRGVLCYTQRGAANILGSDGAIPISKVSDTLVNNYLMFILILHLLIVIFQFYYSLIVALYGC